jgi:tripartite motif-containing protein 71
VKTGGACAGLLLSALGAFAAEDVRFALRPIGIIDSHLEEGPIGVPRGVALDRNTGELWVVDTRGARLGLFTADGVPLFATTPGNHLKEPTRAVVDGRGRLLVLDIDHTAVKVLNYRGEYLGTLELSGLPDEPSLGAIAMGPDGNLYVGENSQGRVHVYAPDLRPVLKFGSVGTEEGQFQSIAGIAVSENAIYVVDHQVIAVQVFDKRGRFLRGWGRHDMGPANFSLPEAVALDSKGRVVVVDALRHEIKFFDPEGKFLSRFGGFGRRAGNVSFPCDVAIDAADRVYVAERGNGRVQVFELVESTTSAVRR